MEYAVPLVAPALQVLSFVQQTNAKLLDNESKIRTGLKNLHDVLEEIAVDVEKYEMQELQALAYDIEDFLPDIFIPSRLGFILTALGLDKGSRQILDVIEYFSQKLEKIEKRPKVMAASGSVEDEEPVWLRRSVKDELVGKAKSELVELLSLSAADAQLRVVSIVGFNGLGKTALAWAVYHDPDVANNFPFKAFVVASEGNREAGDGAVPKKTRNMLREDLLKKILKQFRCCEAARDDTSAAGRSGDDLAGLTDELRKFLTQKRNCEAARDDTSAAGRSGDDLAGLTDELRTFLTQKRNCEAARDDTSAAGRSGDDLAGLTDELRKFLTQKRCLVVVDDIKEHGLCDFLKDYVFPNNEESRSRIIVTTSIQSVASSLSSRRYRYTMRGLNDEDSLELLLREIDGIRSRAIVNSFESILSKCDGSPLALVSVAKHLSREPDQRLVPKKCRSVENELGTHVSGATRDSAFWELKRSLDECYGSLPRYHDRRCLLSVTMSPRDHEINKKSLLRRWTAEGLVSAREQITDVDVGSDSFEGFVNRSIMDAGLTGSNSKVKRYKVQGIMLEFIVHKSTCATNFATIIDPLIHPEGRLPLKKDVNNRIRRLFVSEAAKKELIEEVEDHLDYIRWLTICHSPTSTRIPFDLRKCKLLRVLVLEGCKGVEGTVLASICELKKSLKYLNLRRSDVRQIPKEITALVNLETLDIRETEVNQLPIEVLLMPGLAHLFGKFELAGSLAVNGKKSKGKGKKMELFSGESKLQTLSGVDIHDEEEQGFKEFLLHAKNLKKVKIWCKETTPAAIIPTEKFIGSKFLDSLSLDTGDKSMDILLSGLMNSFEASWCIRYLKLRGKLQELPEAFISKLDKLEELELSSTGLSWEDLSVLQNMSCLLKLKLVEGPHEFGNESFIVEEGRFNSLQQLCIEAPKLPKVQLKRGATPCLVSLELMVSGDTQDQNHATPQIQATTETITAEQEAPLQQGAASENLFRGLKKTLYAKARKVGRLRCNPCWTQPAVQNAAASEITTQQPGHTGTASEITTQQAGHTGTASEITTHQQQLDPRVQVGTATGETSHQPEQNAFQTGGTSEVTTHPPELLTHTDIEEIEPRLRVEGLLHLEYLHEVILHHSTADMSDWEKVANMHMNKPYIKKSSPGRKTTPQAS